MEEQKRIAAARHKKNLLMTDLPFFCFETSLSPAFFDVAGVSGVW
ncbi:MAG: hypothetical protein ACLFQB_12845 [Chitinispirillaceae bacterium]